MRSRHRDNGAPVQAGIYCRLSLAKYGDTTNVEDQERICRDLATGRGWEVVRVYTDNSRSAWQRRRHRPGWDAMLADVEAAKLSAIVVYHGDRLVRQPYDLELLVNLAYGKGIKLASPTGTRDLSNDDDLFIVRIEAAAACRESANTSRRVKRDIARRGARGIVNSGGRGGRPFGFASDGLTPAPGEQEIIREVTTRVLAGEGIRTLATELARRGVVTTAGKPMHPVAIRRMIANPRYAGLMPDGVTRGAWEPVTNRADWETANAVLAMRGGELPPGHNARKYLLSGIAECGACGSGLQILSGPTRQVSAYRCIQDGCRKVYRSMELLDAYVSRRTVNRLANPANPAAQQMAAAGLAAQYGALQEEYARTQALAEDPDQRHVHILLGRLDSIEARLAELRQLADVDARARVRHAHTGITAEEFGALPLVTRRALVAACWQVVVLPASKRGAGFRTEDVLLTPR